MSLELRVYSLDQQVTGQFDDGKIIESKPISFPGENNGTGSQRLGPLFYWSWAESKAPATIALHPHRSFEIMSYVLSGEIGHKDTLGNKSFVGEGGAQVMQTGSGIAHEEHFPTAGTQMFQIWFEPYLEEAKLRAPTYQEHPSSVFGTTEKNGVSIKTIIGQGSPVSLVADVKMSELLIPAGKEWALQLGSNRAAAIVVAEGVLQVLSGPRSENASKKDFVVVKANEGATLRLSAVSELKLFLIEVPTEVDYPLYPKSQP